MTKILGIEVEPIENFVKANFDPRFSLFKRKIPKILETYEKLFDSVLKTPLTYRQKTAVILNEKRNLVVAGAGTGKTTTIVVKVLYLVKSGICEENKILVLAFGKKAQEELSERLKALGLHKVNVKTFHALGRSIIGDAYKKIPVMSDLSTQESKLAEFIDDTLRDLFHNNKDVFESLVEFNLFNEFETYEKSKNRILKTEYDYEQWLFNNKLITINNEEVKSYSELRLANYLFLQGIAYEYEAQHEKEEIYNPDFKLINENIYIELWGIDENGDTAPHINKDDYLEEMENKKEFHKKEKTKLIEIFYHEMREKNWKEIINEKLKKFKIKRNTLNKKQIEEALFRLDEGQKLINKYKLYISFLNLYKSNVTLTIDKLREKTNGDDRSEIFLDIFEALYNKYQSRLKIEGTIDFQDMINKATQAIKNEDFKNPWDYIIIDEFQDFSWDQYRFVNNLLHQSGKDKKSFLGLNDKMQGPKLYCVGDDWQAIYRFRGADYNLMVDYRKFLGIKRWLLNSYTRIELDETFRFNDQLAHTSEKFILENKNQINKKLRTAEKRHEPAVFLYWSPDSTDDKILDWLSKHADQKEYKKKNLMILYRYGFHKPNNRIVKQINERWSVNGNVEYNTCHGAKGLESDIVLLIDLHSGKHGFPSTKEDDPLIDLLLVKKENHAFAEERRLFYVALTRAKYETHLLCDSGSVSEFAKELNEQEKYKTISIENFDDNKECPLCDQGYIVKKYNSKKKSYFHSCNKFPQCDFVGEKCDSCQDYVSAELGRCINEKCKKTYEVCSLCEKGIIVPRVNKRDGSKFKSCSTWPWTGCRGKE